MRVLCVALALVALVLSGPVSAGDLDQSRLYNLKALKYLKSKAYDDAIREFQRAFYAAPSSKPLTNIAKVYDEILKRKDLALEYYKMAIEHAETDRERDELSLAAARLKGDLLQQRTLLQVRTPGVEADVSLKTAETGAPVLQCLSPCDLWVENGAFILVATKKGFHYVEKPVTVTAKGVMLVTLDMQESSDRGAVSVTSNVEGATVLVEGQKVGVTPFRGTFAPGRLRLRLEKPGFGTWSTDLELAPSETQSVHVFLKTDEEVLMEGAHAAPEPAPLPVVAAAPCPEVPPAPAEPMAVCPVAAPCPTCPTDGSCPPPPPPQVVEKVVEKAVRTGGGSVPRWLKWVFLGTGAGVAGGGVGLQMLGNAKMGQANDLVPGPGYETRFFDLRDQGARYTNLAYLGYGLGGAMVVTGSVLWILEALEKPARKPATLESPYRPGESPDLPPVPGGVQP